MLQTHACIAVGFAGRKHRFGRNLALVYTLSTSAFVAAAVLNWRQYMAYAMIANAVLHYWHIPVMALLQCLCIAPKPCSIPIDMAKYTESLK